MKKTERDVERPLILSEAMKSLMGIDDECKSPMPSLCDAAMVGNRKGQPTVVCVEPEKKCRWRDKEKRRFSNGHQPPEL
jgi:hypothetical protein